MRTASRSALGEDQSEDREQSDLAKQTIGEARLLGGHDCDARAPPAGKVSELACKRRWQCHGRPSIPGCYKEAASISIFVLRSNEDRCRLRRRLHMRCKQGHLGKGQGLHDGRCERMLRYMALVALGACVNGFAAAQDTAPNTASPAFAVAYLDKDADGKVSLNEYLNFQFPKLAAGDANANGKLSAKEFGINSGGRGQIKRGPQLPPLRQGQGQGPRGGANFSATTAISSRPSSTPTRTGS